jgi:rSAM/selenodomain-associated transferase 2
MRTPFSTQLASIIVPTFDEGARIATHLSGLQGWRRAGHEVILVDGGSADDTVAAAAPLVDRLIVTPRGRAVQMNAGATAAHGDTLIFLHADTRLPPHAPELIAAALRERYWGRFDVVIEGEGRMLTLVGAAMNLRSRLTGVATGDQAMFMRTSAYRAVGGFPTLPLMEDIAMSRRLKKLSAPACLRARAVTSGRRWDRDGVIRTIALMWMVRLAFFAGAPASRLERIYYGGSERIAGRVTGRPPH